MNKRILFLVVGVLLVGGAAFGVWRFYASRSQTPPPEESSTTEGGGDALSADGPAGEDAPLFSGTSEPNLTPDEGIRTITASACPDTWADKPDADEDGLPDTVEQTFQTDPNVKDTDGDGFSDGEEVQKGYDPVVPGAARLDRDNDGLLDHEECQWKSDPTNPDSDGDGFQDGAEVTNDFDPLKAGDGKGSDALPARKDQQANATINRFRPNALSSNYTEGLAAVLLGDRPASEAAQVQVTPERVQQILSTATLNTSLPQVSLNEIRAMATNTPQDIQTYLRAIDATRPPTFDAQTLTTAITDAFRGQKQALAGIRIQLQEYERALLNVNTPASAVPHHILHIALIRFVNSRLLIIEQYAPTDAVRTYLAAREMEAAMPYSAQLQEQRANLQSIARGAGGTF